MFNGLIYVTTEHDLEAGFSKAIANGPFFPDPVIQVSVKANDMVFLTFNEKIYTASH